MIKLGTPYIEADEIRAAEEVLLTKNLVQGKKVEEFEAIIKDYLGIKHAIVVSSGTAALHLSLMCLRLSNEDEVIVPDFTFPATANVVEILGMKTRLVDIESESLCIDPLKVESAINENTKVIVPVHEFGQAARMDELLKIAKEKNLIIIEDAACAFGAEYKGKKVGTIGDIGCFSLHPRKAITTGEGGIIVTNNSHYAKIIKRLRNHGIEIVDNVPAFIDAGLNYRMTDIQAAIGIVQFRKITELYSKRIELARLYDELLSEIPEIMRPVKMNYSSHIYQTYFIKLRNNMRQKKFIEFLKDKGVESNIGAYAVHKQPYYNNKYQYSEQEFAHSNEAYYSGIALPMHNYLTHNDIEYIVDCIKLFISFEKGEMDEDRGIKL